jgi:hypothetical protein
MTQWSPALAQSESLAQVVLHAFVEVSHTKGAHCLVTGAGQLPWPSQVAAWVSIPLVQLAVRHDVVMPT